MTVDPFQISLSTLIEVSPILGHPLEDRSHVRSRQDTALLERIQAGTEYLLPEDEPLSSFFVAPLDILVYEEEGRKRFHMMELNGTGIGGLSNIGADALAGLLDHVAAMAGEIPGEPWPLVLIAYSGRESGLAPRLNKLVYEKILYAEALKKGFAAQGQAAVIRTMPVLAQQQGFSLDRPTLVLGYIKEFVQNLTLDQGQLYLFGHPVSAIINDRCCANIFFQFMGESIDFRRMLPINRCFAHGSDKGVAYEALNRLMARPNTLGQFPSLAPPMQFERVFDKESLLNAVIRRVRQEQSVVIKPQGTGLGHGIDFFFPDTPEASVRQKVEESVALTENYYRLTGGAFPYTVCEFFDACMIQDPAHPLNGHKYELRIVAYREGRLLKAFPSIVKIASEAYDPTVRSRISLINNITASAGKQKTDGYRFILPLCSQETLDLLGLSVAQVSEICQFATHYVGFILEELSSQPDLCLGRFLPNLPEPCVAD
jgi:hypothetical protein